MEKTEDDECRLVRLYQRLGAVRTFGRTDNFLCIHSQAELSLMEVEEPERARLVKGALAVHQQKPFHGAVRAHKNNENNQ